MLVSKLFHDKGPEGQALVVLLKAAAHMGEVVIIDDKVVDHQQHKFLISKNQATKMAMRAGLAVDQVECSVDWYQKKFNEMVVMETVNGKEVKRHLLPPITQVQAYRIGPKINQFSTALYRGVANPSKKRQYISFKPVLFKQDTLDFILSKSELSDNVNDSQFLAKKINASFYGPSREDLADFLGGWHTAVGAIEGENGTENVANQPTGNIEQDLDRAAAQTGLSKTELREMYHGHMAQNALFLEAIRSETNVRNTAASAIHGTVGEIVQHGKRLEAQGNRLEAQGSRLDRALDVAAHIHGSSEKNLATLRSVHESHCRIGSGIFEGNFNFAALMEGEETNTPPPEAANNPPPDPPASVPDPDEGIEEVPSPPSTPNNQPIEYPTPRRSTRARRQRFPLH